MLSPSLARRLLDELARTSPAPAADGRALAELTAREREALQRVGAGWRNQEIAGELGMAVNTVKVHLRNILEKREPRNRQHAAACAVQAGLLAAAVPAGRIGPSRCNTPGLAGPYGLWLRKGNRACLPLW